VWGRVKQDPAPPAGRIGHRHGCATRVASPARRRRRCARRPTELASCRGRASSDGSVAGCSCWSTSQSTAAWIEPAPSSSSRSERRSLRAANVRRARREVSRWGNMCSQGMLARGRIDANTRTCRPAAPEFGLPMRIFVMTGCNAACKRAAPVCRRARLRTPAGTHTSARMRTRSCAAAARGRRGHRYARAQKRLRAARGRSAMGLGAHVNRCTCRQVRDGGTRT